MSHRTSTITAVAALTALMLAGGGPALAARQAGAAAGEPARAGGSVAGRMTALARPAQRVLLITGDVVLLSDRPGGPRTASVIRARTRGPGGQFQMFTENGDQYVVPQSAVPYLGSALSLSLFDVTRLAKQEHGAMSLAVQLKLRPAGRRAALPGITVSQRSRRMATARLTLASARRFGAALARQASNYSSAAAHSAGLFAGVASIAPATAGRPAPPPAVHPARSGTTDTLTVNGINAAGAPDNADIVFIYNVDNLKTYENALAFQNGVATFQVPPGHYEALCYFSLASPIAVTINPQFTVAGATSITLDARDATAPVSVTTPQRASAAINQLGFGRTDAKGNLVPYSYIGNGQTRFTVQPFTSSVTAGKLYYYFYTRRYSPGGAKTQYSYDLQFPSSGTVPANEHYTVTASDLASVRSSYPATHSGQAAIDARYGALPWETDVSTSLVPLTTPLTRTEYYTASPGVLWSGLYYAVDQTSPTTAFLGQLSSTWTSYHAGQSSRAVWGGQPEHPRLLETDLYPHHAYCPACLAGSTLDLLAYPFSDNSPSHYGFPDSTAPPGGTESESYDVYADGTEIGQGGFLQSSLALPTGTKHVRIDYNTTRSSSDFTLSTSANTTWTVQTSAPRAALPSGWYCSFSNDTACTVLPLMSANYHLPVNPLGQLSPGPVSAGVHLNHLAGANIPVNSLSIKVSFDGGTSWTPATVTSQGPGQYKVTFTVPAQAQTDGFGAIKLTATDADGGTLSQTISRAFAVTAS